MVFASIFSMIKCPEDISSVCVTWWSELVTGYFLSSLLQTQKTSQSLNLLAYDVIPTDTNRDRWTLLFCVFSTYDKLAKKKKKNHLSHHWVIVIFILDSGQTKHRAQWRRRQRWRQRQRRSRRGTASISLHHDLIIVVRILYSEQTWALDTKERAVI